MKTSIIPEVGDKYKITDLLFGFGFKNKAGGTGMSNWDYNKRYIGPLPIVEITKVWYDYEVGYRCWAKAINQELIDYMADVADDTDQRIFVSEHELSPL